MAVDSHNIILGSWSGTRRNVTIEFFDGAQKVWYLSLFGNPDTYDDAFAIALYPTINEMLGERELDIARDLIDRYQDPDTLTTYISQVDFDRRLLGYIMTVVDPHKVNACSTFWQNVQPRNGANATARATNLGVSQAEYNQVENRLNAYFGASTFLSNDLSAIWDQGWD